MDIFAEKTILTVSRLTALIRGVLEENFEHVWVQGEISNLSVPSSGHAYFTLKDAGAQIRCVMFKGALKNLRFRPTDGMGLIIRGRVSVYDQRGEYQIICEYMEPAGLGALQAAFLQLKEKLEREGLFDASRKQPLPALPRKVGVITSPTGAAIHDILNVIRRRFAAIKVVLYPVRVQGEGAAAEIAAAIDDMNRQIDVDVLIVGRGGGSLEDLWAFNEECVARAVRRSRVPVISAVGHETDVTICDFAADLRAPTPSAAAELVSASAEDLRNRIDTLSHRLRLALQAGLKNRRSRIDLLRRALHDPATLLGHLSQRIDDIEARLRQALKSSVRRHRDTWRRLEQALQYQSPMLQVDAAQRQVAQLSDRAERRIVAVIEEYRTALGECTARLEVLSPLGTLARGYALALDYHGKTLNDAAALHPGDVISVRLHRGSAGCRVESTSLLTPETTR